MASKGMLSGLWYTDSMEEDFNIIQPDYAAQQVQQAITNAAQQARNPSNYLQAGVGQALQQAQQNMGPSIHVKALQLLKARLAGLDNSYTIAPDEIILTHVYQDKVFVFFVLKGKAGYLEDEASLFPSDGLITKLRVIR